MCRASECTMLCESHPSMPKTVIGGGDVVSSSEMFEEVGATRRSVLMCAGLLSFIGLTGALHGCRSAVRDELTPTEVVLPPTGELIFDAALSSQQGLDVYPHQINTGPSSQTGMLRAQLVQDPVHGPRRTVLRLASDSEATHGDFPTLRVQCETDYMLRSAAHGNFSNIFYTGLSLYLPNEFRTLHDEDWLTFASPAYGPPYGGSGSLSLGLRPPLQSDEPRLVLGDLPHLLGEVTVPVQRWVDFVVGLRLAYASEGGWLSLWMNHGSGWRTLPILGEERAPYDTLQRGVNDGWHRGESDNPNSSRIGVYGNEPNTLLHGWHRIGRSFEDVMPNSHPGTPFGDRVLGSR